MVGMWNWLCCIRMAWNKTRKKNTIIVNGRSVEKGGDLATTSENKKKDNMTYSEILLLFISRDLIVVTKISQLLTKLFMNYIKSPFFWGRLFLHPWHIFSWINSRFSILVFRVFFLCFYAICFDEHTIP